MNNKQTIGFWIIWFVFLQSAFVIHFVIGGGFPSGENEVEPMASWLWLVCAVPMLLAAAIRWLVIPKLKEQQKRFVAMIVGLAFAEQPIFFSIFLIGTDYPQYQIAVLMVSVVSLIQFAPSYATPGYEIDV
ncbi:MAG: hypothetical protein ACSHX8_06100 [Opitutaceae bacterium]